MQLFLLEGTFTDTDSESDAEKDLWDPLSSVYDMQSWRLPPPIIEKSWDAGET